MFDMLRRMGFDYWLTWQWLRLHFNLCHRLTVTGAENIPVSGGIILAANHCSHLDSPPVAISATRRIRFIADEGMLDTFFILRLIHRWDKIIFFKRGESGSEMVDVSVKALNEGDAVLIYPEGTRTRSGFPGPPRIGMIVMAVHARVPIIPIRISGTFDIMPPGKNYRPFGKIQVSFGKPVMLDFENVNLEDHSQLESEAARIMDAIFKLPGWHPINARKTDNTIGV